MIESYWLLQVKELEDAVVELLGTSEDCTQFSAAIQSVGNEHQPRPEVLEFFLLFTGYPLFVGWIIFYHVLDLSLFSSAVNWF